MAHAIKYGMTQLPESREWFRLVSGTVNTLQDYGIENLFGAAVGPVGQLAKGIDGAYYGKKTLEDIDAVYISIRDYRAGAPNATVTNIFHACVKCTGDSFAILKWAGAIGGIVILAPHAKTFGYVKNVCSVYSAVITIHTGSRQFLVHYNTDTSAMSPIQLKDRQKQMALAVVAVVASLCSAWLNGMGGLDSWVGGGAAFAEKGLQRLQPWTFNAAIIISNTALVSKKIAFN